MVFGVVNRETIPAFSLVRNDWESDFFAMEIGKLQFPTFQQTALAIESAVFEPFELVQCKIAADQMAQIRCLQQLGFQFVEGELDFCLPLSESMPKSQPDSQALQPASVADIDELEILFGEAFTASRFRQPWFSRQQNQDFYRTWIRKAVLGEFDDLCLLARAGDGRIQGGVSLRALDKDNARVGLLAVAPHARGQGVAKRLLQSAVNWGWQQQHKQLWIATQSGNQAAINLYQRQGRIERIAYWFYR